MREPRPSRFTLVVVIACALYGAFLVTHASRAVGGSDSSGYLNLARLLAAGETTSRVPGLEAFGPEEAQAGRSVPLAFVLHRTDPPVMVPFYPPGYPLLVVPFATVFGWERGPFLVPGVFAAVGVFLLFATARALGIDRLLAAGCAAALAAWPAYLTFGAQSMSDTVTAAWSIGAVLLAITAWRTGGAWAAFACGAVFVFSVVIRPPNVLLLPALTPFLLPSPARLLRFVAGGLPVGIPWLIYNASLYGSPLRTGYAPEHDLAWAHFPDRFVHYGGWLLATLPLPVLAWLALPAVRSVPRRVRISLIGWGAAYFVFYCFYRHYDTWWYTRFLSPAAPALLLAAGLLLQHALPRLAPRSWRPIAVALLAVTVAIGLWQSARLDALRGVAAQHKFIRGTDWVRELDGPAIVASMQFSGALHYYNDVVPARYERFDPETFATLRRDTELAGYRWYALLEQWELQHLRRTMPADWAPVSQYDDVSLWRLPPLPAAEHVGLHRRGLIEILDGLRALPSDRASGRHARRARRALRWLRNGEVARARPLLRRLERVLSRDPDAGPEVVDARARLQLWLRFPEEVDAGRGDRRQRR